MHVVAAYFIAAEAVRKQRTYGSLGVAAALLLGLYILGRLLIGGASSTRACARGAPARPAGAVSLRTPTPGAAPRATPSCRRRAAASAYG